MIMMAIKWRTIIITIVFLMIIARSRQIAAKLRELRIGDMLSETINIIWDMPSLGRYAVVLAVAALLYITVFVLIIRRK